MSEKVEKQLQISEARHRAMLDALPDVTFRISRDGTFLDYHTENESDLAIPPDKIIGGNISQVPMPTEVVDKIYSAINRALEMDTIQYIEYSLPMPEGLFDYEARIIRSGDDEVIAVVRNITEQKKAERKLQESEEQLRLITDNLPVLISYVDRDLRYQFVNKQYEEWFKTPQKNIIGKHVKDVIGSKTYKKIKGDLTTALSGETGSYEHYISYPDGIDRYIRSAVVPHIDDAGEIKGLFTVVNDLSNRKKIEEALHESQQRLEAIFEHVQAGIFIVEEENHTVVDANTTAIRMIGYPKENIVGKLCHNFISHADKGTCPVTDLKETVNNSEQVLIDITGTEIPILKTVVPMHIGDKRFLVESFVDLTARKQAEESLRESEYFNEEIISCAGEGIVVFDKDLRYVVWNRFMEEITGISSEEALGKNAMELSSPLRERGIDKLLGRAMHGKTVRSPDTRFQNPDTGKKNWVVSVYSPHKNAQGEIVGVVGTIREISPRKNAEQEIEKLSRFPSENPNPVLRLDKNGELLYSNTAGGTMIDLWQQESKGTIQDILHEYIEDILAVDQTVQHEVEIQDRTYSITFAPFKEAGYINVYGMDITVQKRLEDNLRQSQKMEAIGQLAGGIAHDFNNQLSGIMGYADLIREEVGENAMLSRYADNVLISTKRAADLTSQLLAYARKGKYLSVPVNIHKVLFEVVSLLEHSIDKRIALNQELHANPSVTIGDPSQLQNALLNIALNARDAMADGGELVLSTEVVNLGERFCKESVYNIEPGDYIKIGIKDSGIGMSEDVMEHIFEPFFTTKEVGKGTGMGLAAVYGAIKNHKGAIEVKSELKKGSTFYVYLPLAEISGISTQMDSTQKVIKGSPHILLVDDEKMVHEIGCDILKSLGYTVTVCSNGREAVEYYKKSWEDIALVILDLVMPEMSGGEAFKVMKEINPDIRVLVSSGYSINGEARDLLEAGANGFIQKPFRKAEISQKIAEVLEFVE